MPAFPPSPTQASPPRSLPAGQTQTHFNSAYVEIAKFVFNPTLVSGFLHRSASDESVPVTEVFYGSHHVSVEDPKEALYFFLCQHTHPQAVKVTV
jgi:hypothetical protein